MSKLRTTRKKIQGKRRSPCPVACVLDILGDKWTLLVVRDLFVGKTTFNKLQDSPEGIPTNILADRLKRLAKAGIIAKSQYQRRPVRYAYTLTESGRHLGPIIKLILQWGHKYIPDTYWTSDIERKFSK